MSRYLLKCEGLAKPDAVHVRTHLEMAFYEFGLPYRIRSDNGPPFVAGSIGGLSELSVWWIKLGITLERKEEVTNYAKRDLAEQQLAFDRFRRIFNDERPHGRPNRDGVA